MTRHPYAFISYCHRNNDVVLPILEKIQERNLHIWFDKGIEVGSEWPEFIAESLMNCSCVVAFISRASLESQNCRREINFAIDKKLDIVIAYLEDCELSPGMQLQLNTLQAIFRSNYPNDEAFVEALLKASILEPCIEVIPEPEPEPEPEPVPVAPVAEPKPKSPAPAVKPEPKKLTKAKKASTSATSTKATSQKKKSPLPLVIAGVVVIALIVGGVALLGGGSGSNKTGSSSSGQAVKRSQSNNLISDLDLVGRWQIVSVENNGDGTVKASKGSTFGITYLSDYFGTFFSNDSGSLYADRPTGHLSVSDGTITFPNLSQSIGEGDFSISYSIEAATDEEIASVNSSTTYSALVKSTYSNATNTKLVVTITGTLKESSTVYKSINTVVTLIRKYPLYDNAVLAAGLLGTWNDNYGGAWTFEGFDNDNNVIFTRTTADGNNLKGKHVYLSANESGEYVSFRFVDNNAEDIANAKILSFDGQTLRLERKEGGELVLTRTGYPNS